MRPKLLDFSGQRLSPEDPSMPFKATISPAFASEILFLPKPSKAIEQYALLILPSRKQVKQTYFLLIWPRVTSNVQPVNELKV